MYTRDNGYRLFQIISMTNVTGCVWELIPVHFSYMEQRTVTVGADMRQPTSTV